MSQSHVPQVIEYTDNQPEHHKRVTFQEEFRTICAKYEIDIDERYVWD